MPETKKLNDELSDEQLNKAAGGEKFDGYQCYNCRKEYWGIPAKRGAYLYCPNCFRLLFGGTGSDNTNERP